MRLKDFIIPRGYSNYILECPKLNERVGYNKYSDFKSYIEKICSKHSCFMVTGRNSIGRKGGGVTCVITVEPTETESKDIHINLIDTLEITNVMFNPPATIIFWRDGTKTVVKTQEDFDPEKGLAMAISKKMFGNNYGYYNVFQKWLKKWDKHIESNDTAIDKVSEALKKLRVAFVPTALSTEYKIFEETNATLEQLTGYDAKELIKKIAAGEIEITAVAKNKIHIADLDDLSETCYMDFCKNCQYFVPSNELDKRLYPNPLDADGACLATPETTYVDAFDTCNKGVRKIDKDE